MSDLAPNGYIPLGKTGDKGANVTYVDTTLPKANAVLVLLQTNFLKAADLGLLYKGLILNLFSSHVSATNGVEVAESWNGGANWRLTNYVYTLAANTPFKLYAKVSGNDIRVRFTNGAVDTTTFEWSLLGDPHERGNG